MKQGFTPFRKLIKITPLRNYFRRFSPDLADRKTVWFNFLTGFTLIEVLITITILVILTGTLIFYSRTAEYQIVLFREQAKVVSAISRAKTLSITALGQSPVPCGYGVYFATPRTVILFKNLPANCAVADRVYSGPAEILESFNLDPEVEIQSASLSDVLFIPPDPTIVITPAQQTATIVLKATAGEITAAVTVTASGQISAQ